jgi:NO-binding membrane sensor protein with MHYT domain/two-component sensor histidine kinase
MHHSHHLTFVALSVLIAVFGAWTALDLLRRVRSHIGQAQTVWLAGASLVMGISIWAMHFVAMLGFDPGAQVSYDPLLTLTSLVVAIAATSGAFFAASRPGVTRAGVALAGLAMGTGICLMHYIGMSALRTDAALSYDRTYVLAAFAIAVAASTAALFAARRERSLRWRAVAATVLGLAIVGMHYTAMGGLTVSMDPSMHVAQGAPPFVLGVAVASGAMVILILALLASLYDQRLNVLLALDGGDVGYWELTLKTMDLKLSRRGKVLLGGDAELPFDYPALLAGLSPEARERRRAALDRAIHEAAPYDLEYRIETAAGQGRWVNIRGRVVAWTNGRPVRMAGVVIDITDRQDAHAALAEAEGRQRLLIDELNHRVKNTLATVQSITRQTAKGASSIPAFRASLEARLMSLSGTHNLLTRSSWEWASLRDLAAQETAPHAANQVALAGPDVQVSPRQALPIGMIFHELATNAAKYGALSAPGGRVDVGWRVDGGTLRIEWRESGGPSVTAPSRRGFGSTLIERLAVGELGGTAAVDFAPGGLECRVEVPLAAAS